MKVIYLAIDISAKKWSMPLKDWKPANQPIYEYVSRLNANLTAGYTDFFHS
jgi:transposase-like protein